MWNFFWPEYACNTQSQVILAEEDFRDNSSVDYLPEFDPELEAEEIPA